MVALYVVSSEEAAGKTAVCAGLGKYLLGNGKKVGFFKPRLAEGDDGDAAFMKQVLDLPENIESLSPPISDVKKIKEAYDTLSQDKDVVIVEGTAGQITNDNYEIARALDARVIIVEAYSNQSSRSINSYKGFGDNLLGIVLNKVPVSQLKRVHDEASAKFGEAGINVLGVLPEDRTLSTLTIGELADCVQGKILNCAEKSAELVENFMLGAMVVDSGLEYFSRKTNKAAVLRNDRPDMQLAALETSTRCLVLSGSTATPIYSVLNKAESKGIPIILTENDTSAVVTGIEGALGKTRFNQEKKLPKLVEIMQQHLNLQGVS